MKSLLRLLGFAMLPLLAGLLAGCATGAGDGAPPPLILVSMDGFRWDYCEKYPAETPNLRQLRQEGCSARELIPVFPSNTFPNHYAIVTGLYPAHHGIINNEMFDPRTQVYFHYNRPASVHESVWWEGEPIWVTAIKQGHPSASHFWVGSEAEIGGYRPTYWKPYDSKMPFDQRLEEIIGWLRQPPEKRPVIVTFYMEETNSAGHRFGPDSPEIANAVKLLDSRLGAIRARLKAEQMTANFVVVSDHGMTPISLSRVIILDDYLDPSTVQTDFFGPVCGLRPLEGTPESIVTALSAVPHVKAYLAKDLPARYHMSGNPRIPPVWVVPEEGWEVGPRKYYQSVRGKFNRGDHGFDPQYQSMHGILMAAGPSFRSGVVIDAVENVNIYNLLCAALHLKPATNDGDDRLVKAFLK